MVAGPSHWRQLGKTARGRSLAEAVVVGLAAAGPAGIRPAAALAEAVADCQERGQDLAHYLPQLRSYTCLAQWSGPATYGSGAYLQP